MTTRGNVKHQAAVATTAELVDQLRVDIHRELVVLVGLVEQLEDLADTRQSVGLGFLTDDARTARDKQTKADRDAARGLVGRVEAAGLVWMNTTTVLGTGQVPAPVTVTAVSASVEILFALQYQLRRLARPAAIAAAAAVPGGRGRLPIGLPTTDTDVAGLARQLGDMVDVYTNRQGLEHLLRDLDHLEAIARDVIDGPACTNHPDICPWCGRNTLVIHHREKGRDTQLIRCEGRHPCECDWTWCECHRNPVRNRHEWINSGRAAHTWNELHNLQIKRKELTLMETRALDALAKIRTLHQPNATTFIASEWLSWLDETHECTDNCVSADVLDADGHVVEQEVHEVPACGTCRDDAGYEPAYPCPTVQALDLTQPAEDSPEEN